MTKQLTDKAIDIKGKKYVLVSDRVLYFNETYPNGSITTERFSEWELEIVKATITPDCAKPERYFTGYSQAKWGDWFINKTSALENAETSAVGRALAMMWIGVIDSIASADEINKAETYPSKKKPIEDGPFTDWPSNPEPDWFEKAKQWTKFMQNCLDEEDFIQKIKDRVKEIWAKMTKQQETDLRICYQNAKAMEDLVQKSESLPEFFK